MAIRDAKEERKSVSEHSRGLSLAIIQRGFNPSDTSLDLFSTICVDSDFDFFEKVV